jgi:hypothetical protein
MKLWPRQLPWLDAMAGLTVGVLVLILRDFLTGFYGLSPGVVTFIGAGNAGYALFGSTLGALRERPRALLYWLVFANFSWSAVCVLLAVEVWASASIFGLAHIIAEGLFVAGLALLEIRYRREILGPVRPPLAR